MILNHHASEILGHLKKYHLVTEACLRYVPLTLAACRAPAILLV